MTDENKKAEDSPDFSFLGETDEASSGTDGEAPDFRFDVPESSELPGPPGEGDFNAVTVDDAPSFDGIEVSPPVDFTNANEKSPVEDVLPAINETSQAAETPSDEDLKTQPAQEEETDQGPKDMEPVATDSGTDVQPAEPDADNPDPSLDFPSPDTPNIPDVQVETKEAEVPVKTAKPLRKLPRRETAETPVVPPDVVSSDVVSSEDETMQNNEATDRALSDQNQSTGISKRTFSIIAGYAVALTILFLVLLLTGRLSLSGQHPLESLPDIEPLKTGDFKEFSSEIDGKKVEVELPPQHDLNLGESRRFGDLVVTPVRVTREIVSAVNSLRKNSKPEPRSEGPVLKLWFSVENVSESSSFAPWDLGLMCHRHPKFSNDPSTLANSWLKVETAEGGKSTRILNYMHNPESQYSLVDQNSGKVLKPGESTETYVACSEDVQHVSASSVTSYRWRLQIRKGVNLNSGNGVTTLIDITFQPEDVKASNEA